MCKDVGHKTEGGSRSIVEINIMIINCGLLSQSHAFQVYLIIKIA